MKQKLQEIRDVVLEYFYLEAPDNQDVVNDDIIDDLFDDLSHLYNDQEIDSERYDLDVLIVLDQLIDEGILTTESCEGYSLVLSN